MRTEPEPITSPAPLFNAMFPPVLVFELPAVRLDKPPVLPSPDDNKMLAPELLVSKVISPACCVLFPAATMLSVGIPTPDVIDTLPLDALYEDLVAMSRLPLEAGP